MKEGEEEADHVLPPMADLLYHAFAFLALFIYGLYHLLSAARTHHSLPSSPAPTARVADHGARPYYPLALPAHRHHLLRHLPFYLGLLSLLIAVAFHFLLSAGEARAAAQRISFYESASALLLFLLLSASVVLLPLPTDLVFVLASLAFALLSAASAHSAAVREQHELQSKCDAISSLVSAVSAAAALALAVAPRLIVAEFTLAASVALQGLWSLQTGLSLYVEGFIPMGCHLLLGLRDVPSTRCDLEDLRLRAFALLDLAFTIHTIVIALVTSIVYVTSSPNAVWGFVRRHNGGSYEALPTSSASALSDIDHIQMKAISKSTAQA